MMAIWTHDLLFQSAPPVKGAMNTIKALRKNLRVSIRAPREGGDNLVQAQISMFQVSIRAPREGGDSCCVTPSSSTTSFNPRPP